MDLFYYNSCYIGLLIFKVVFQYVYGGLCLCCFCKLLGFVSICFVGFYGLYHAMQPLCSVAIILLAKCYAFSLSILTLVP